jgi:hypothetical protein
MNLNLISVSHIEIIQMKAGRMMGIYLEISLILKVEADFLA